MRKRTISREPALFQAKETTDPLVAVGTKIPYSILQRLEDFVKQTGESKAAVYRDALDWYLMAMEKRMSIQSLPSTRTEISLPFGQDRSEP